MKTCFYCKSNAVEVTITTVFTGKENQILVIDNVPCFKCSQCYEQFFSSETSRILYEIEKTFENISTDDFITQVNYAQYVLMHSEDLEQTKKLFQGV